jgi:hypothetical protein
MSAVVAAWLVLELVPVTVSVNVPFDVLVDVVTFMVDEPPAVIGFVLNVALAPEGRPLALRVMLDAEPDVTAEPTV